MDSTFVCLATITGELCCIFFMLRRIWVVLDLSEHQIARATNQLTRIGDILERDRT